jgi:hypothetical protein
MVGVRTPVKVRFSAAVQKDPGTQSASSKLHTVSLVWVMRPGFGVHHPRPASAEVKERVKLYVCSLSLSLSLYAFMSCYRVKFTLFYLTYLQHGNKTSGCTKKVLLKLRMRVSFLRHYSTFYASTLYDGIRSGQSGHRTVDEYRHVKLSLHSNSHN